MRRADEIRLLTFRSVFSGCTVTPLHLQQMKRAAALRAATRLQTADLMHLGSRRSLGL